MGVMTGKTRIAAWCVGLLIAATARAQQQTVPLPFDASRVGPGAPAFAVRPGYRVTLAADNIERARFLEFDDAGNLFLSRPSSGEILRLRDANGDGVYGPNERAVFISGFDSPHGMNFTNGWLWFATPTGVHRARDENNDGKADKVENILPEGSQPGKGGHWWRSILVGENVFYTSVGDGGNITDETRTDRQKLFTFRLDGSGKRLIASGIRNTEKLRFRPRVAPDGAVTLTDEVWGVDHGSDNYGREFGERGGSRGQPVTDVWPPDEFNKYDEGKFYGHPYVTGRGLPRLEHRYNDDILDLAKRNTAPMWEFGAHWAANGWTFLARDHFGGDHKGDAMVALRGSWNSSIPVGYGVERVCFDRVTGRPYGSLRIVNTLGEDGRTVLARPVDCAEAPDGTVLFSCDVTGKVFRIARE